MIPHPEYTRRPAFVRWREAFHDDPFEFCTIAGGLVVGVGLVIWTIYLVLSLDIADLVAARLP